MRTNANSRIGKYCCFLFLQVVGCLVRVFTWNFELISLNRCDPGGYVWPWLSVLNFSKIVSSWVTFVRLKKNIGSSAQITVVTNLKQSWNTFWNNSITISYVIIIQCGITIRIWLFITLFTLISEPVEANSFRTCPESICRDCLTIFEILKSAG